MRQRELIILNSKDRKLILQQLNEEFGISELPELVYFCLNSKEKVYCATRDLFDQDHERLRVNAFGMYFGTYMIDGFRLSLEGVQLLQDQIIKNKFDVHEHQRDAWLKGEDVELEVDEEISRYVVLYYKGDILGVGKLKETKILNYLPKSRRLKKIISYEE